ncbi:MAG TPA: mycothiol synthase [Aeromicrobium sp.]|nr:mycothiol synthase [Aeromicrobium sp.]
MNLIELAHLAHVADGVSPFNEASLIALTDGASLRVDLLSEFGGAVAVGDAPVEFAIAPSHRRQGHGASLLAQLLAAGETRFWAHGDLPAAVSLAAAAGLVAERVLLRLSSTNSVVPDFGVAEGLTIRTFDDGDAEELVALNARAFANHPEQGQMTLADFNRRRAEPWFDPAGVFIAVRDGQMVGFHWTKVEGQTGEVYVVGVDPSAHGGGIGTALTAAGLRYLWGRGVAEVDLYVEGDNVPALKVYRNLGFGERARDVLYVVS